MALLRISSNQNKMLKYFKKMTDHFNGTGVEEGMMKEQNFGI